MHKVSIVIGSTVVTGEYVTYARNRGGTVTEVQFVRESDGRFVDWNREKNGGVATILS